MYDVQLMLIRKPVPDFLLVIIEPFSLGAMVQALQANIDWKSPFLKGVGHFGPKFQVEGDVPCQEMENIVRISLWFGMLRRPSRDSMGGARDPETHGSTARCRVVGRSNPCRC